MDIYYKRRMETIKQLSRNDPIHQDYKDINKLKSDLLSGLLHRGDIHYKKASINSVLNLSQNVMNQLSKGEPYHGVTTSKRNIENIQNYADSLRGYQSRLQADLQDSRKLNAHIFNKYHKEIAAHQEMRFSSSQGRNPKYHPDNNIKIETWNHHYQNEASLIHQLEGQLDNYAWVLDFDNKYAKRNSHYVKYITSNNQTFYFPEKMLDLYGDSKANPALVPNLINDRNNHEARYKCNARLINNQWRQIYSLEVNHHWFNYDTIDKYTRATDKADGSYQYKTVHDEVWYQYYLDRIRNAKNSMKDTRSLQNKDNNKIQKQLHHVQYLINTKRPYTKYWFNLAKKRDVLRRELNSSSNYATNQQINIKHYQNKANWWLNQINSRNKNFKDVLTKNMEKLNRVETIKNVRYDSRYTHFGYIRPRNPGSDHSYIYFKIEDESPTYTTQVNSTPSEWGVNATTGTTTQQTQVQISGELFNPNFSSLNNADGNHGYFHDNSDDTTNPDDAGESGNNNQIWRQYYGVMNDSNTLKDWSQQGAEMFYSGQNWYPHCIISEFTPDYNNSGDDGSVTSISFSMTLTLCNYFQSNATSRSKSSHNHGGKDRNSGKKSTRNSNIPFSIPVKQGYTYCGIAARYHVSVSKLKNLNHWASRRIPIYVHGRRNRIKLR